MQNGTELEKMVRVFVVSDFHAFTSTNATRKRKTKETPSFIDVAAASTAPTDQPLISLEQQIESSGIRADALICCGDLGDRADPTGIRHVWDFLQRLKSKLTARLLISTVGNHDLDSRFQANDYDPKEYLQSLQPLFPSVEQSKCDEFWARHFTVHLESDFRIVVVDSCAFHGKKEEDAHGRISNLTLTALSQRITKDGRFPLNILVCHHHPQKQTEYNLGESDDMKNGQILLDMLAADPNNDWIVIHGHKHCPKISYAAGGVSSPTVLSCGSVGAKLYPELNGSARNQWYLLEFPIHLFEKYGLVGTFKAWDWIPQLGCQEARANSGLPSKGGFGIRNTVPVLASTVRASFLKPERQPWSSILKQSPELEFVLPGDIRMMAKHLESRYKIRAQFSETGLIDEVELFE